MRISARVVLCAIVLVGTTGWFKACSSDPDSGGEDPPRTANDIVEATVSGTAAIDVLGNDQNLVNEPLTLSIEDGPFVGSASFNADRTVRLDLPADFRGVTRFRYRVTNSLGGFATSTAVVFVGVPAYRVLFAAASATRPLELYITDLTSAVQVSQAVSGPLRLQNAWKSQTGGLVVYERADPAALNSTSELFYVRTSPISDPARIPRPSGRRFDTSVPVAVSDDDRWIALATVSTSGAGQATNLHVFDTNGSGSAEPVGLSGNLLPGTVDWVGDQLYFMAAPGGNTGAAVYRSGPGRFDAPERVSPVYGSLDTHDRLQVSPDQTKLVILGSHAGRDGLYFVAPATPNTERRLTTDMPASAVVESFELDDDFTKAVYLWRLNPAVARLSVTSVDSVSQPDTVIEADITAFTELRPDGLAALVTRGPGGAGSDGVLYEVAVDNSSANPQVASNVSGGVYDGTGDRVYLFSRTLPPAVIERSNFNRGVSRLVRSSTPPLALFVAPILAPSAAIIEDPTLGLVLVNAAAPGQTLRLTNLDVGPVPQTLLPDAIQ